MAKKSGTHATYITIRAAAEMLSVDERTIRRRIAHGDLRGYRLGGRVIRVAQDEVLALLKPIPTSNAS